MSEVSDLSQRLAVATYLAEHYGAPQNWRGVSALSAQLAELLPVTSPEGAAARTGAVIAAMNAYYFAQAAYYCERYLVEADGTAETANRLRGLRLNIIRRQHTGQLQLRAAGFPVYWTPDDEPWLMVEVFDVPPGLQLSMGARLRKFLSDLVTPAPPVGVSFLYGKETHLTEPWHRPSVKELLAREPRAEREELVDDWLMGWLEVTGPLHLDQWLGLSDDEYVRYVADPSFILEEK